MKRYMSLVLLLLLNGCGQYSIRNIDKPPPEDYETWERPNHSILQVKKTLLECGAIAPSTVGWDYKKGYEKIGILGKDSQMNEAIKKSKCMENAGYKKKGAVGRHNSFVRTVTSL